MLTIENLTVDLGGQNILHDLNMAVPAGQVSVILGPNGSGKSTLLRAIAGELPYGGSIRLEQHEIRAAKAWELASLRGVLPQSTAVAFPFTVAEVVRLGLRAGVNADQAGIVHAALAEVRMQDFADRPVQDLSGGQMARVHLARVRAQIWHGGPGTWLFLDEPVASLDIGHQLEVMQIMRAFAQTGGGVVAVMHDLNLSTMVADRMILMKQGKIVAQGAPGQVMHDRILTEVYDCPVRVAQAPPDRAWVLPQSFGAAS